MALGRIELDVNEYEVFIKILKDIAGMGLIVGKLTGSYNYFARAIACVVLLPSSIIAATKNVQYWSCRGRPQHLYIANLRKVKL